MLDVTIGGSRVAPGDRVVYPNGGICRVRGLATQRIADRDWHMLMLQREEDGATVMVPKEKIVSIGLRKVATGDAIALLFQFLGSSMDDPELDWKVRHRENFEKMAAGGLLDTAQVLKGLHALAMVRPLPTKEREMYDSARHQLVGEIAASLGLPPAVAENNIDYALTPPPGSGRTAPKDLPIDLKVLRRAQGGGKRPSDEDDFELGDEDELLGRPAGEGPGQGEGEEEGESEGEETAEPAADNEDVEEPAAKKKTPAPRPKAAPKAKAPRAKVEAAPAPAPIEAEPVPIPPPEPKPIAAPAAEVPAPAPAKPMPAAAKSEPPAAPKPAPIESASPRPAAPAAKAAHPAEPKAHAAAAAKPAPSAKKPAARKEAAAPAKTSAAKAASGRTAGRAVKPAVAGHAGTGKAPAKPAAHPAAKSPAKPAAKTSARPAKGTRK